MQGGTLTFVKGSPNWLSLRFYQAKILRATASVQPDILYIRAAGKSSAAPYTPGNEYDSGLSVA